MTLVQYTGKRSPAKDPAGFIRKLREKYSNLDEEDVRTMYTRAVMLSQPPTTSRALFGADILSDDVTKAPWWRLISPRYRQLILSHPVETGMVLRGSGQARKAILHQGESRRGINRQSLISVEGLENTYVWCKMNEWTQDVSPHDLAIIRRSTDGKMRDFNRAIRVIEDEGPYDYVRPYGGAVVRERIRARTVDEIKYIFQDQSSKDIFHGFDPVKE